MDTHLLAGILVFSLLIGAPLVIALMIWILALFGFRGG